MAACTNMILDEIKKLRKVIKKGNFDWITIATEKFHEYKAEAERYGKENENVQELALINAGKALALSELLEMVDRKPLAAMEKEETK